MSERIFEISGHLENFKEGMFGALDMEGGAYRPKPMNCPGHIAIYQSQQRSYRDLPIRMAEFGTCYRYERSGVLHGMLRVRGFTQDDAHIFCTPGQVREEIERLLDLVDEILTAFGYPYTIELATKPEEKALGSDEQWSSAIQTLADTLESRGIPFEYDEGGGSLLRAQAGLQAHRRNRAEVAGTDGSARLQLAGSLRAGVRGRGQRAPSPHHASPRAGGLDGAVRGWAHRALRGGVPALARSGASPRASHLRTLPGFGLGLREPAQSRRHPRRPADRETLSYRIRDAEMHKVPYMAVIGEREAEAGTVAVRKRGAGKKAGGRRSGRVPRAGEGRDREAGAGVIARGGIAQYGGASTDVDGPGSEPERFLVVKNQTTSHPNMAPQRHQGVECWSHRFEA